MQKSSRHFLKWLLTLMLLVGSVTATTAFTQPTTAHATTVYVTRTGKHYFYKRHDRGLNRAKKVFAVSLNTAKKRGLTLSATETAPKKTTVTHHKTVKKSVVRKAAKKTPKKVTTTKRSTTTTYHVKKVNHNRPTFTKKTLSTKRGAWQKYGQLDGYNRATTANALLNKRLMPTSERAALTVDPTGWHNKHISSGWLYNRCHLIGYQLTGQNNNLRNLITGTRQLNDPGMTKYENKVASYLKASPKHYVRYQVKPVFKKHELLARGVKMQGQSVGSKKIKFNVYLPNTQSGMKLNYATGRSQVAK